MNSHENTMQCMASTHFIHSHMHFFGVFDCSCLSLKVTSGSSSELSSVFIVHLFPVDISSSSSAFLFLFFFFFFLFLQEDWIGTWGISISLCLLTLFAGIPLLGAAGRNPGHGTKIARGLDGYTKYRSATVH